MSHSLSVVVEPTHPMSSSNTKDNNIFRLANGNYISRMAYVKHPAAVWYADAEAYLVGIRKNTGGYTYRSVAVSV